MRRIIDLTLEAANKMLMRDASQSNIYVSIVPHEGSKSFDTGTPEDPSTSIWNYLSTVEYTDTRMDAFYHMSPKGPPIDQMPLDLFFGKAVCLGMRHTPTRGNIIVSDVGKAGKEAEVIIQSHIILFATRVHEWHLPSKDILCMNLDTASETVAWLAPCGSRTYGMEGSSTDITDTQLFPSRWACRDLGLPRYEWLVNLDQLIGRGEFPFCGVLLEFKDGSGSPVKALAVIEG